MRYANASFSRPRAASIWSRIASVIVRLHSMSEEIDFDDRTRACFIVSTINSPGSHTRQVSPMRRQSSADNHSELISAHVALCRPSSAGNV
jgi:hypothetical protein